MLNHKPVIQCAEERRARLAALGLPVRDVRDRPQKVGQAAVKQLAQHFELVAGARYNQPVNTYRVATEREQTARPTCNG